MAAPGSFPKVKGDKVSIADYNYLQNLVKETKTDFYGANMVSTQISGQLFVTAAQWNQLLFDINYVASIQGIALQTNITTKDKSMKITAADINAYYAGAQQIGGNKKSLWSIMASKTSVNEGEQVNGIITSQFVKDGTVIFWKMVPWNPGPIDETDINDNIIQGQIAINNNSAILERVIKADQKTEGTETFVFAIYSDAGYSNLLASSEVVYIQDTSQSYTPPSDSTGDSVDTSTTDGSGQDGTEGGVDGEGGDGAGVDVSGGAGNDGTSGSASGGGVM